MKNHYQKSFILRYVYHTMVLHPFVMIPNLQLFIAMGVRTTISHPANLRRILVELTQAKTEDVGERHRPHYCPCVSLCRVV